VQWRATTLSALHSAGIRVHLRRTRSGSEPSSRQKVPYFPLQLETEGWWNINKAHPSTLNGLEVRLASLEQAFRLQGKRLADLESRCPPQCRVHSSNANNTETPAALSSDSPIVVDLEDVHDHPSDGTTTDGMAISFVDEENCGFFGPSSSIELIRHIFRTTSRKGRMARSAFPRLASSNEVDGNAALAINITDAASPADAIASSLQPSLLPPDDEIQTLLRAYFSNTGLLFPFLHEPTFLETYQRMRRDRFRVNVSRTWLGLLNMMLAMAVCTASPPRSGIADNRTERSRIFYYRARGLCKKHMVRVTTLETGIPLPTQLYTVP